MPALHTSTSFRLGVLGAHVTGRLLADERVHGLTAKQLGTLSVVDQGLAASQQELATLMGISASMVVKVVDALERSGLLTRTRDPRNRRRHVLALTEQGRQVLADAAEAAADLDKALDQTLGEDLPAVGRGLAALIAQLARGQL